MVKRLNPLRVLVLALAGAALFAGFDTAQAQEVAQAQPVERVIVTGSAIPRTETETPSPVQVITREEIQKTGATSVNDVLRSLSTNGNSNLQQNFSGAFAG